MDHVLTQRRGISRQHTTSQHRRTPKARAGHHAGKQTLSKAIEWQTPSVRPVIPLSSVDQQNRTRLLKQIRATWIEGLLEQSLHRAAWIDQHLQEPDPTSSKDRPQDAPVARCVFPWAHYIANRMYVHLWVSPFTHHITRKKGTSHERSRKHTTTPGTRGH